MFHFWFFINRLDTKFNLDTNDEKKMNEIFFSYIKNFYDDFIFLLIYAGCVNLAELLCNNYADNVLSSANLKTDPTNISHDNIKSFFMK